MGPYNVWPATTSRSGYVLKLSFHFRSGCPVLENYPIIIIIGRHLWRTELAAWLSESAAEIAAPFLDSVGMTRQQ
jgi:hypothetical protein